MHGGEYKNLKEVIYQGLGKTDPISKKNKGKPVANIIKSNIQLRNWTYASNVDPRRLD